MLFLINLVKNVAAAELINLYNPSYLINSAFDIIRMPKYAIRIKRNVKGKIKKHL